MRAKIIWGVLLVITFAIWGGGYAFEKTYTRAETSSKSYVKGDFKDSGYIGPMFLYMFYGFYDGTSTPDPANKTDRMLTRCFQLPGKPACTGSWAQ